MAKFQRRKQNEPWITVETSRIDNMTSISTTLDRLQRSWKDQQLRAVNDKNQLLEVR